MLLVMVGIFLLPIQPSFEINKDGKLALEIKTNKVEAEDYTNLFPGSSIKWLSGSSSTAEFEVNIIGKQSDWDKVEYILTNSILGIFAKNENSTVLVVMENGNYVSSYDLSGEVLVNSSKVGILPPYSWLGPLTINGWKSVLNLTPGKNYTADFYVQSGTAGDGGGINLFGSTRKNYYKFGTGTSFSTPAEGGSLTGDDPTAPRPNDGSTAPFTFDCGIINLGGCVAQFFYLFFTIAAWIAKLASWFLDFFVYYSTNSTSYTSGFVTKGWAAIRDVANIFFIIALLYIAIKTILSLNVTNNKKMIGTIIIVALLINFSLFFSRVIIDGSNILAKVFYNNITTKDEAPGTTVSGTGEKPISIGLISKFNPQKLVTAEVYKGDGGIALFIFITILATFIVLYAAYIFFSVGLLFVSRVVMLWISMIFAPIAFSSYTLPFEIPGLGHKDWWKELLQNAFLAPIFIFMLYIIVMFTTFLSEIVKFPEGADFMQKVMSVVIPFAILTVLLMKSKEMAIKYAGEMGAAMNKAGAMVGGLALGAATGGAAMLGRGTLGAIGSKIANSSALAKLEAGGGGMGKFGKMLGTGTRNIGKTAAKGSFDVRGIKIAGKDLSSTGMSNMKAGGQGGYEKDKATKSAKREARSEELKKTIEKGKKGKGVKKMEEDLKALENALNPQLDKINKDIEIAKEKLSNTKGVAGKEEETKDLYKQLTKLQNEKTTTVV